MNNYFGCFDKKKKKKLQYTSVLIWLVLNFYFIILDDFILTLIYRCNYYYFYDFSELYTTCSNNYEVILLS